MRLFIASPAEIIDYRQIQNEFAGIIEGKWVEEPNLHLTWIFLGETKDPKPIIEKLKLITPFSDPKPITGLGYFGRPPRILFASSKEKSLYDKAKEFRGAGFDIYRFKPHITLCRIKKINDYKIFKEKVKSCKDLELGIIKPEINLYQSILSNNGPEYSIVGSIDKYSP